MNSEPRGSAPALAFSESSSVSPDAVLAATTSVTWKGMPSASMSWTTWVTGRPLACSMRSIRSRRSQPETVAGKVDTMISSGWCSATASIVAV